MVSRYPDWAALTPQVAATELPRLLAAAEKAVAAIEASEPKSYEELVWKLDDASRDLWEMWGAISHLLSVRNSAEWRKVQQDFQEQIVMFSLRCGQSRPLYAATKRLAAAERDPVRRRILERSLLGYEHAGVGLEGEKKERFNAISAELVKLGSDFRDCVIDATKAFSLEKDGKTYTIDDANYPETMKHCTDREVRERLYRARATRAPENEARIPKILALRQEEAELLGYSDYIALSLSTKCAPSREAVFEMIDALDQATLKGAEREERELSDAVAAENGGGKVLEPWDRAFYAERLRERKYDYSEDELKKHFEMKDVLAGLWKMASFLFGVEIVEVTGAEKPSVWHPDVRFFEIRERGRLLAEFYLDPYVRNGEKSGGAWMNEFRNRNDRRGETPLAVVVTNFPLPDQAGKTYLPMREVETVFHEFGHTLQCCLTRIGEEDAAGINLVEWDAVEIASQFMENWCLDDRTGIRLPAELKAKVRSAKNFRAATACRRQLAFAKLDLMLHDRPQNSPSAPSSAALQKSMFDHFGLKTIEGDRFLCSFGHIFAGGYAAGYYGYKWAEVMSADCFGAFEDAGLENDAAVQKIGREYRETILGLGGSQSAYDVFCRFRGRRPSIEALLRQQGLGK